MTIAVDDKDPTFAAELANAHIGALSRFMEKLAVTEAQQRRVYLEQQVKTTQQALMQALMQAESNFRTYSVTLRGQIAAKEVEERSQTHRHAPICHRPKPRNANRSQSISRPAQLTEQSGRGRRPPP